MADTHILVARDISKLIDGQVFDSGDAEYARARNIDNGRVSHEPSLFVQPDHVADVAAVVGYCKTNSLRYTIKSGGHSAAGYCLNSGHIVLDLARVASVEYFDNGLRLGAGARWIDAYDFLKQRNDQRIMIGGGCPGVGVGGFLLGGGYSFLSRSFGLGSDNIDAIELVTVDGDVHHLSNSENDADKRELMWGLQGAGGGNFGVATRFDVNLCEVHDPLMVGQIVFPFYRAKEILAFYDDWTTTLPDQMAVYGMMRDSPDPRNTGASMLSLRFTPIFNGRYAAGIDLLQPLLNLGPVTAEFHAMTLPQWESFISTATSVHGKSAYIRSVVMAERQLSRAEEVFRYWMARRPSRDSYIVWTHTGGKVKKYDASHSSYCHRDAAVTVEVKSVWDSSKPDLSRLNIEWAFQFFEDLRPYAQGAYINYIDPLLPEWQDMYYRDHYDRLLAIKAQWDPDGSLDFLQGIGSNHAPSADLPLDLSVLQRTF